MNEIGEATVKPEPEVREERSLPGRATLDLPRACAREARETSGSQPARQGIEDAFPLSQRLTSFDAAGRKGIGKAVS
jgi:hypothetical protein